MLRNEHRIHHRPSICRGTLTLILTISLLAAPLAWAQEPEPHDLALGMELRGGSPELGEKAAPACWGVGCSGLFKDLVLKIELRPNGIVLLHAKPPLKDALSLSPANCSSSNVLYLRDVSSPGSPHSESVLNALYVAKALDASIWVIWNNPTGDGACWVHRVDLY